VVSRKLPTIREPHRPKTCPEPSCAAPLDLPYLCGDCGTLFRAPPDLSHFERFGLTPKIDLNAETLETLYVALSRKLHPDRMVGKKPSVQTRALVLSSELNKSYLILKDERQRAEHLLTLLGGKTSEEDKRTPQPLLLEMMDYHETIEEARERGDAARLNEMLDMALKGQADCLSRVHRGLAAATPDLDGLREQLNVAKYWHTLRGMVETALASATAA
jgi:molecular chaperone HscB